MPRPKRVWPGGEVFRVPYHGVARLTLFEEAKKRVLTPPVGYQQAAAPIENQFAFAVYQAEYSYQAALTAQDPNAWPQYQAALQTAGDTRNAAIQPLMAAQQAAVTQAERDRTANLADGERDRAERLADREQTFTQTLHKSRQIATVAGAASAGFWSAARSMPRVVVEFRELQEKRMALRAQVASHVLADSVAPTEHQSEPALRANQSSGATDQSLT
jgi:hypothetical protein